jgi:predicted nucleic acid-binding protein
VILADTSVWIGHFRGVEAGLVPLLQVGRVVMHPFILGELALGNFGNRAQVLGDLAALPMAAVAMEAEVMRFIETERLFGLGIGYVDAHLLAAVRLTPGVRLWTRDKRLGVVAERFGVIVRP